MFGLGFSPISFFPTFLFSFYRFLDRNQLKYLPSIEPTTTLRYLSLTSNRISRSQSQFRTFTSLKALNLSSNRITDLRGTDFPRSLETLDLRDNRIQRLIPNSFKELGALRRFILSRNRLKSIKGEDIFGGELGQALRLLDLSHNKLTTIFTSTNSVG